MNKKITLFVLLALTVLLVACGGAVPDIDVSQYTDQITALTSQVTDAEGALAAANAKIEELGSMGSSEVETVTQEVAVQFAGGGDTLGDVKARGELNCGVPTGASPGFGFIEADGTYTGFDYEFCRVVATATLNDADAVVTRPLTSTERFPVLQSGEVDMLSRQTTWTLSRDTSLGTNFGPTTFYDGQGMMVLSESGITDLAGLEGGSICVGAGTTTEKNLADVMRSLGINYEAVVFEGDATRQAYDEGRCDGWTTDKSALVSGQTIMSDPSIHTILAVTMSKEPLGPVVRHGDDNWFDIVQWSTFCTFQAEEKGVTSANVDEMLGSDDPEILNLLGVEGDLGQAMGLDNDFCYQIIKQVGNYAEIYAANLGPDTQFDLARGVNSLWTDGGLLYSPPFR